ncbi:aldo/keto reductase [Listeria fleischmannii 1991]|uniref:2,5-diketo-D-gluconic acid reductase A n=2 Tax=Listeria fleischmannii TaxID=1069827 RepID=A0A2X3H7S5_9LIST|nr:aldo/keto reductase [Listeria fleischmannii]EMG27526.1 2,5-diketo-D-gluconic acid reductase A [Listeria fleischmannii subsp. fleischmannii LU2006-1]KMT60971.1 aldo/keto reductase [Listeria fleischmannii 1991]SQC70586.1 2,5-diketo-D-gluconic acid reductase A [Listeria fleischmannii subsp. fleischmannii]
MNNLELPQIGLGTWLLTDYNELKAAIHAALEEGYRHIDTAQMYNNEADIGLILEAEKIDRNDLFLTTKIAPMNYLKHTRASVFGSLRRLKTDYLDLVLLHAEIQSELNLQAYKELIELQKEGKIKHIGVSNFSISGIQYLIEKTGVKPYMNQIVCSPTTRPIELETFCKENDIQLTGYSILKPYFTPNPFYPESALTSSEKQFLDQLCEKYDVGIGQLLNRWAIQHGYHVIPKSSRAKRVIENYHMDFTISDTDMESIDQMNRFSAEEYQENVKQWENQITDQMLEKGLLYDTHFVRDF